MSYSKEQVKATPVKVTSRPQTWLQSTPGATAMMSKMVPDRNDAYNKPGNGVDVRDPTVFDNLVGRRAQRNLDAQTIISLAPDIKLIKQMIVSTILSPVDMTEGKLMFKTAACDISPLILNQVTEVIREHFETYYPLREKLPEILGEALFDCGAWVSVIVPEAVIDDVINAREGSTAVTLESFNEKFKGNFVDGTLRSVGILGNPGITDADIIAADKEKKKLSNKSGPSLENMFSFREKEDVSTKINDAVTITDNLAIMGLTHVRDRINTQRINNHYSATAKSRAALESFNRSRSDHNNVSTITNSLYRTRTGTGGLKPVAIMGASHEASRSSIGHPLMIKCPSESVIPCYPRGEERNHIGYVIILDELGNPINLTEELNNAVNAGTLGVSGGGQQMNLSSSLIQQTRIAQNGTCMNMDKVQEAERGRIFSRVLEENILNRIKNGLAGRNVRMAWNEDIMRVMLFRHWSNQRTNLVFVPAEQVAYFAYDFDNNGMGKSLLDDVKQVSALRAMTTFANFMAGVKNAVGRTKVSMNIDPRNPDPEKAYHVLMDEYQRMQATVTPTDVSSSAEMFRILRMMGTTVEVQGNPRMPNTTVEISEYQSQKQQIDENFTNELRRQQYMGLNVTPGMVDMTDEADFAITRWTSNQLYAKRIMMYQDDTCKIGKKMVASYVNSDGVLINRIQRVFRDSNDKLPDNLQMKKEDQIPNELQYLDAIEVFLDALYLELPRPENNRIDKQKEEFDKVSEMINEVVDSNISQELFSAFSPDDTTTIDLLRAHLIAYMKREYLAQNGVDFGFSKLVSPVTEEDPAIDLIKLFSTNMGNIINNLGDFSKSFHAIREEFLNKLKVINPKQAEILAPDENAGGFGGGSSGSADANFSGGGDAFGGGDFGSFDDVGGGEENGDDPFALPPDENPEGAEGNNEESGDATDSFENPPSF